VVGVSRDTVSVLYSVPRATATRWAGCISVSLACGRTHLLAACSLHALSVHSVQGLFVTAKCTYLLRVSLYLLLFFNGEYCKKLRNLTSEFVKRFIVLIASPLFVDLNTVSVV
jgi:hypothetical protein